MVSDKNDAAAFLAAMTAKPSAEGATMVRWLGVLVGASVLGCSVADAAVTFKFTGEMIGGGSTGSVPLPFAPGTPFSLSYTYESGGDDLEPSRDFEGVFDNRATAYVLSIGTYSISESTAPISASRYFLMSSGGETSVSLGTSVTGSPPVGGLRVGGFTIALAGSGVSMDPNVLGVLPFAALLAAPLGGSTSGGDFFALNFVDDAGNSAGSQSGIFTTVTPIPAAALLLAPALLGLGMIRGRRKLHA
jgi:hypothetical protein